MKPEERAESLLRDVYTCCVLKPKFPCPGCVKLAAKAIIDAEAAVREQCCEAIRAACECCGGDGQHDWPDGEVLGCTHCEWPIAAIRNPPAESEELLSRLASNQAQSILDEMSESQNSSCGNLQLDASENDGGQSGEAG